MDRLLYVSMSGAKQVMLAQGAVSNNLANANTIGFREDFQAFRAMPVYGPGEPTRVYAMAERPGTDLAPGAIQTTGGDLDIAVDGEGWIAVQANDGSEAYTRSGDLRIAGGGVLVTGAGHPVLGNGGPIVIPAAEKIDVAGDGTISARTVGQEANALTVLDRIKLVKPDAKQLFKGDDGLMRVQSGQDAEPDASVKLLSGALESSNVNTIEALVQQITLGRQFELQVKMMKTAEEIDSATSQMMRLS